MSSSKPSPSVSVWLRRLGRGGAPDALLDRLRERQARRDDVRRRIRRLQQNVVVAPVAALERRIREKLADWRGLLMRNVDSGREVPQALLLEPLRFSPVVDARHRGTASPAGSRSIG